MIEFGGCDENGYREIRLVSELEDAPEGTLVQWYLDGQPYGSPVPPGEIRGKVPGDGQVHYLELHIVGYEGGADGERVKFPSCERDTVEADIRHVRFADECDEEGNRAIQLVPQIAPAEEAERVVVQWYIDGEPVGQPGPPEPLVDKMPGDGKTHLAELRVLQPENARGDTEQFVLPACDSEPLRVTIDDVEFADCDEEGNRPLRVTLRLSESTASASDVVVQWYLDGQPVGQPGSLGPFVGRIHGDGESHQIEVRVLEPDNSEGDTTTFEVPECARIAVEIIDVEFAECDSEGHRPLRLTPSLTGAEGDEVVVQWYLDGEPLGQPGPLEHYVGSSPGDGGTHVAELRVVSPEGVEPATHSFELPECEPACEIVSVEIAEDCNDDGTRTLTLVSAVPGHDQAMVRWLLDGEEIVTEAQVGEVAADVRGTGADQVLELEVLQPESAGRVEQVVLVPVCRTTAHNSDNLLVHAAGTGSGAALPGIFLRWELLGELGASDLPTAAEPIRLSRYSYIPEPLEVPVRELAAGGTEVVGAGGPHNVRLKPVSRGSQELVVENEQLVFVSLDFAGRASVELRREMDGVDVLLAKQSVSGRYETFVDAATSVHFSGSLTAASLDTYSDLVARAQTEPVQIGEFGLPSAGGSGVGRLTSLGSRNSVESWLEHTGAGFGLTQLEEDWERPGGLGELSSASQSAGENGELSIESVPGCEPLEQTLSASDLVGIASLDYPSAVMLGLGTIDTSVEPGETYVYCVEFGERQRFSLPTSVKDERGPAVPLAPTLEQAPAIPASSGPRSMLSEAGYDLLRPHRRHVGLSMSVERSRFTEVSSNEEVDDFNCAEHTPSEICAVAHSIDGVSKGLLSNHETGAASLCLPQTPLGAFDDEQPIPTGLPSFTHVQLDPGAHQYRAVAVDLFGRRSEPSEPVGHDPTDFGQSEGLTGGVAAIRAAIDEDNRGQLNFDFVVNTASPEKFDQRAIQLEFRRQRPAFSLGEVWSADSSGVGAWLEVALETADPESTEVFVGGMCATDSASYRIKKVEPGATEGRVRLLVRQNRLASFDPALGVSGGLLESVDRPAVGETITLLEDLAAGHGEWLAIPSVSEPDLSPASGVRSLTSGTLAADATVVGQLDSVFPGFVRAVVDGDPKTSSNAVPLINQLDPYQGSIEILGAESTNRDIEDSIGPEHMVKVRVDQQPGTAAPQLVFERLAFGAAEQVLWNREARARVRQVLAESGDNAVEEFFNDLIDHAYGDRPMPQKWSSVPAPNSDLLPGSTTTLNPESTREALDLLFEKVRVDDETLDLEQSADALRERDADDAGIQSFRDVEPMPGWSIYRVREVTTDTSQAATHRPVFHSLSAKRRQYASVFASVVSSGELDSMAEQRFAFGGEGDQVEPPLRHCGKVDVSLEISIRNLGEIDPTLKLVRRLDHSGLASAPVESEGVHEWNLAEVVDGHGNATLTDNVPAGIGQLARYYLASSAEGFETMDLVASIELPFTPAGEDGWSPTVDASRTRLSRARLGRSGLELVPLRRRLLDVKRFGDVQAVRQGPSIVRLPAGWASEEGSTAVLGAPQAVATSAGVTTTIKTFANGELELGPADVGWRGTIGGFAVALDRLTLGFVDGALVNRDVSGLIEIGSESTGTVRNVPIDDIADRDRRLELISRGSVEAPVFELPLGSGAALNVTALRGPVRHRDSWVFEASGNLVCRRPGSQHQLCEIPLERVAIDRGGNVSLIEPENNFPTPKLVNFGPAILAVDSLMIRRLPDVDGVEIVFAGDSEGSRREVRLHSPGSSAQGSGEHSLSTNSWPFESEAMWAGTPHPIQVVASLDFETGDEGEVVLAGHGTARIGDGQIQFPVEVNADFIQGTWSAEASAVSASGLPVSRGLSVLASNGSCAHSPTAPEVDVEEDLQVRVGSAVNLGSGFSATVGVGPQGDPANSMTALAGAMSRSAAEGSTSVLASHGRLWCDGAYEYTLEGDGDGYFSIEAGLTALAPTNRDTHAAILIGAYGPKAAIRFGANDSDEALSFMGSGTCTDQGLDFTGRGAIDLEFTSAVAGQAGPEISLHVDGLGEVNGHLHPANHGSAPVLGASLGIHGSGQLRVGALRLDLPVGAALGLAEHVWAGHFVQTISRAGRAIELAVPLAIPAGIVRPNPIDLRLEEAVSLVDPKTMAATAVPLSHDVDGRVESIRVPGGFGLSEDALALALRRPASVFLNDAYVQPAATTPPRRSRYFASLERFVPGESGLPSPVVEIVEIPTENENGSGQDRLYVVRTDEQNPNPIPLEHVDWAAVPTDARQPHSGPYSRLAANASFNVLLGNSRIDEGQPDALVVEGPNWALGVHFVESVDWFRLELELTASANVEYQRRSRSAEFETVSSRELDSGHVRLESDPDSAGGIDRLLIFHQPIRSRVTSSSSSLRVLRAVWRPRDHFFNSTGDTP